MSLRASAAKKVAAGSVTFGIAPDELAAFNDNDRGLEVAHKNGGQVGLARQLSTDMRSGRNDSKEAELARIEAFGRNCLPPAEEVTFLELLIEPLADMMMVLLVVSAFISLALGFLVPSPELGRIDYSTCWVEGTAILVSVAIVSFVTAINNYQKEMKFRELESSGPPTHVGVTRAGRLCDIEESELLVGDLMHVTGGQVLPVDAMLVKATGLKLDESAATGEGVEIDKSTDKDFMLRSGSNVLEGEGLAIVTAVGENSFAGRITMEVREKKADTPLQEQLAELAETIGYLGMGAALLMFVVLSVKDLYEVYVQEAHPLVMKKYLDMITTSITIVVVAVPEGLPLSVTIALAYSMKQMFKENNLVRHLAACETMGGATTICTDKTGTLTQNVMTVMRGYMADAIFELDGTDADQRICSKLFGTAATSELTALVSESISMNSSATKKRMPGESGDTPLRYVGNKTEQAMLLFVEKGGADPMILRSRFDPNDVHSYPFTSAKKRMTTCLRLNGIMRYHVKGASEMILADCETIHNGEGPVALTSQKREELTSQINDMARNRLRTIAVAFAETRIGPQNTTGFPQTDEGCPPLCLLGIIGIEDPIRPEVEHSVNLCRKAGVSVRMVTGDNKATAISIAKKAGIYGKVFSGEAKGEQGLAMDGAVFRELAKSETKLNAIIPRLQVLARASPVDKRILVNALMDRGEVVAVTGDGTNDAPALKNAHVGFAMNSGTDVAKKASDVVILDDNFSSIVTAMKWGRNVHDNISKFIQFQTTVNVAAVTIAFVGAIFSERSESPLKPVQLLWLNLIMDTMAALALATEPPTDAVLERAPRGRDSPLISRRMWLNVFGQSIYQICLQLWILHGGYSWFGVAKDSMEHLTVVFNVFVLLQVTNEFNARILDGTVNVLKGLSRAPMFLGVIVVTVVVQWIGVTHAGAFMHTVPLSAVLWKKCMLVSVAPLFIGVLLRLIPVTEVAPRESVCCRRDDKGVPILEDDVMDCPKPKMTFQRAGYCVIAQLKIVGALSEMQSASAAAQDVESAQF